jgi:hypothetical protein
MDTVNGWERNAWQARGFRYFRLGDGNHPLPQ